LNRAISLTFSHGRFHAGHLPNPPLDAVGPAAAALRIEAQTLDKILRRAPHSSLLAGGAERVCRSLVV
jgi:hypothetical protein